MTNTPLAVQLLASAAITLFMPTETELLLLLQLKPGKSILFPWRATGSQLSAFFDAIMRKFRADRNIRVAGGQRSSRAHTVFHEPAVVQDRL